MKDSDQSDAADGDCVLQDECVSLPADDSGQDSPVFIEAPGLDEAIAAEVERGKLRSTIGRGCTGHRKRGRQSLSSPQPLISLEGKRPRHTQPTCNCTIMTTSV